MTAHPGANLDMMDTSVCMYWQGGIGGTVELQAHLFRDVSWHGTKIINDDMEQRIRGTQSSVQ